VISPLIFALCANVCFSIATVYFAEYSRKISALWTNFFKALVAALSFGVVCSVLGVWEALPLPILSLLVLSGLCGLFVGDIFLLKAFAILGSGRVLMIWSFQPLLLGAAAYFLFGQELVWAKLLAMGFLIGCLFTFSFESYKKTGHWEVRGILFALFGISLDAIGILMTRQAFDLSPETSPFMVNFVRCLTTVLAFGILSRVSYFKFHVWTPWTTLSKRDRRVLFAASFAGAFLSLSFYLFAVKNGHLASIAAMTGAAPLFATVYESIMSRKKPTSYLLIGTGFFLTGFLILVLT